MYFTRICFKKVYHNYVSNPQFYIVWQAKPNLKENKRY